MTGEHPPLPRGLERFGYAARLVWRDLDDEGPLSRQDLRGRVIIPDSTLTKALRELDDAGYIERVYDPCDPNAVRYAARRC